MSAQREISRLIIQSDLACNRETTLARQSLLNGCRALACPFRQKGRTVSPFCRKGQTLKEIDPKVHRLVLVLAKNSRSLPRRRESTELPAIDSRLRGSDKKGGAVQLEGIHSNWSSHYR